MREAKERATHLFVGSVFQAESTTSAQVPSQDSQGADVAEWNDLERAAGGKSA